MAAVAMNQSWIIMSYEERGWNNDTLWYLFLQQFNRSSVIAPWLEASAIGLICAASFPANIFTIVHFLRRRGVSTGFRMLIFTAAFANMLLTGVGIVIVPATRISANWLFGSVGCTAFFSVSNASILLSIWSTVLINIERRLCVSGLANSLGHHQSTICNDSSSQNQLQDDRRQQFRVSTSSACATPFSPLIPLISQTSTGTRRRSTDISPSARHRVSSHTSASTITAATVASNSVISKMRGSTETTATYLTHTSGRSAGWIPTWLVALLLLIIVSIDVIIVFVAYGPIELAQVKAINIMEEGGTIADDEPIAWHNFNRRDDGERSASSQESRLATSSVCTLFNYNIQIQINANTINFGGGGFIYILAFAAMAIVVPIPIIIVNYWKIFQSMRLLPYHEAVAAVPTSYLRPSIAPPPHIVVAKSDRIAISASELLHSSSICTKMIAVTDTSNSLLQPPTSRVESDLIVAHRESAYSTMSQSIMQPPLPANQVQMMLRKLRRRKQEIFLAKTMLISLILIIALNIPIHALSIAVSLDESATIQSATFIACLGLMYVNAVVNPLLQTLRYGFFKECRNKIVGHKSGSVIEEAGSRRPSLKAVTPGQSLPKLVTAEQRTCSTPQHIISTEERNIQQQYYTFPDVEKIRRLHINRSHHLEIPSQQEKHIDSLHSKQQPSFHLQEEEESEYLPIS